MDGPIPTRISHQPSAHVLTYLLPKHSSIYRLIQPPSYRYHFPHSHTYLFTYFNTKHIDRPLHTRISSPQHPSAYAYLRILFASNLSSPVNFQAANLTSILIGYSLSIHQSTCVHPTCSSSLLYPLPSPPASHTPSLLSSSPINTPTPMAPPPPPYTKTHPNPPHLTPNISIHPPTHLISTKPQTPLFLIN